MITNLVVANEGPIPVVAYYRMSTDVQTESIPAQREHVRKFCEQHNYFIIREYVEPGISGDDTEKRFQFQKMMNDAAELNDFEYIVVWDLNRFGRFDSMEAGRWCWPLRKNNIGIHSLSDGLIDWDDFSSRIIFAVTTEGNHEFNVKNAKATCRGYLRRAKKGLWCGTDPPIGYDVDRDSEGISLKLILGDEHLIALVREIFEMYLGGQSINGIMRDLNRRMKNPKTGNRWSVNSVARILKTPTYLGHFVWPIKFTSKYFSIYNGEITPTKDVPRNPTGAQAWESLDELKDGRIFIADNHPRIIDDATFWGVQRRLRNNKKRTTPAVNGGGFLFSGLVFCKKCGRKLVARTHRPTNNIYYECSSHRDNGECYAWTVNQKKLVEVVADTLVKWAKHEDTLNAVESELKQLLDQSKSTDSTSVLQSKLSQLESRRTTLETRLCEVSSDMVQAVETRLRECKAEISTVSAKMATVEKMAATADDAGNKVDDHLKQIDLLIELLTDPKLKTQARELLSVLIERIDLDYVVEESPNNVEVRIWKHPKKKGVFSCERYSLNYTWVDGKSKRRMSIPVERDESGEETAESKEAIERERLKLEAELKPQVAEFLKKHPEQVKKYERNRIKVSGGVITLLNPVFQILEQENLTFGLPNVESNENQCITEDSSDKNNYADPQQLVTQSVEGVTSNENSDELNNRDKLLQRHWGVSRVLRIRFTMD